MSLVLSHPGRQWSKILALQNIMTSDAIFASLLLATDSCLIHINIYKLIKSLKEWAYRIALTFHNENLMFLKKKNVRTTGPFSGHTYNLSLKHLHTKDGVCMVCFPHYPVELKGKNYSCSLLQILDKH